MKTIYILKFHNPINFNVTEYQVLTDSFANCIEVAEEIAGESNGSLELTSIERTNRTVIIA